MDDHAKTQLNELLRHYFWPDGPGCAAVVHQRGQLLFESAVGMSHGPQPSPLRLTDRIDLASCSKMFTATAIMQLVEQGRLRLADPISQWFDIPSNPEHRPIQVIDCMRHTSGIEDYLQAGMYTEPAALTQTGIQQTLMNALIEAVPGVAHHYSNSNYVLLAQIIEQVTQDSYTDHLQHHQFQPLGIDAEFLPQHDGWVLAGSGFAELVPSDHIWVEVLGDGGIGLSAPAAAAWFQALIGGRLVQQQTFKQMTQQQCLDDGTPFDYGLGLLLESDQRGQWFGHNGSWTGSTCVMGHYPTDDLSVVILANEFMAPVERLGMQMHRLLTDN
ncbi:serine hydrolase domain-containing protein [Marinicella meishanensis]|uniref:serine hydrolase domain-containing protein n=1 Tax=Marinicella meishanensis TaxID=2873263 RepID=UPI001CBFDA6B|nr:serine hydrolase domain-containing protein [Marinicella sp. NBU2979]